MRFIVDECTGPRVADWLLVNEHEVYSVHNESPGMTDDDILAKAHAERWILITNDKDFGEKIFRDSQPHHGVIFLRLKDERSQSKIETLRNLLENFSEQIADRFVVVTEQQIRFR